MSNITNNKENSVALLNFLSANPAEITATLKESLQTGDIDMLQAYIALKKMNKILENTIDGSKGDKELKENFYTAVQKALDGNKSIEMFGTNLRIQNTGTRYDYTECGDLYLDELYSIKKQVDEAIKQREDEIKALLPVDDNKNLGIRTKKIIQEGMPSLTFSDDEIEYTIRPAIKKSGSSVVCTFKK